MATYQYVNTQGKMSTVDAASSQEAMSAARDIARDSGVMQLPKATLPKITPDQLNSSSVPVSVPATKPGIAAQNIIASYAPTPDQISASRKNAVSDLVYQGVNDPAQVLNYLNYDNSGNRIGDFSEGEVNSLLGSITPAEKRQGDLRSNLTGLMSQYADKSNRELALRSEYGIDQKTQDLNDINNEINRKTLGLRRKTEAIANDSSLTRDQASQFIAEEERKGAMELADLSIVQAARNNNLLAAQSLIKDKIDLEFEPIKQKIDFVKFFYDENKDTLTKEEDRAFQEKMKKDEREYEAAVAEKKQIGDIQLEAAKNGAPVSVIQKISSAKTQGEAAAAAAGYMQDPLDTSIKQAQLTKLRQDISEGNKKTSVVDVGGRKFLVDMNTGKTISEVGAGEGPKGNAMQLAVAQDNIGLISSLLTGKGMTGTVGPYAISRWTPFSPDKTDRVNFIASVEQLRSQLDLDKLIQAKQQGATFGALSEGELKMLSNAATKIGSWAKKDSDGKVVAYVTSEKAMREELERIANFAKLDYILKGGNPSDIGAQQQADGTIWVENTDGSKTQLR